MATFPADDLTPISDATLMGSAARGTMIRPVDDLDVLAVFTNKDGVFEKYRHDSQAFISRLRNRINGATAVKDVGVRGQAVRLFYTDGLSVDIAPVFKWASGGYVLPSGSGGWITTDPPAQTKWASARESALANQFKRRVRLLKRWNTVHSRSLGSWHLEVMVGGVFTSMGSDHRNGIMRFFEWAGPYLHIADPDGHDADLGAGLTRQQQSAVLDSFKSNFERASRAVAHESNGDHKESIRLWRIILGDEFPAYG